jgi:hypothetical protein
VTDTDNYDPRWNGMSIPKRHWHFHRQLLSRYGIVLAPGEFSRMLKEIRAGRMLPVERISATKAVYSIRISRLGERFYVLVDDGQIITALPPSKRLNKLRRESARWDFWRKTDP